MQGVEGGETEDRRCQRHSVGGARVHAQGRLCMNFDAYQKDEDRRQFEKLFQIFADMPPWEPYNNMEQHKYYVRQRIPVEVLR